MREAINTGIAAATGEWLMRADEHCMFGPGWDHVDGYEDDWIVTFRRYQLDPVEWRRMDELKWIDYEKLLVIEKAGFRKFSGVEWRSRARERSALPIDETMAMQGSCWMRPAEWWRRIIGRLETDGYGPD